MRLYPFLTILRLRSHTGCDLLFLHARPNCSVGLGSRGTALTVPQALRWAACARLWVNQKAHRRATGRFLDSVLRRTGGHVVEKGREGRGMREGGVKGPRYVSSGSYRSNFCWDKNPYHVIVGLPRPILIYQ